MATSKLQQVLASLRRRALALGVAAGGLWGLLAACAVALAAMWLDVLMELPAAVRITAILTAAACGIAILVTLTRRTRRTTQPTALARRLDSAGTAHGQIVSAADLEATTQADPLSAGLAKIAVDRASDQASTIRLSAAAPAKILRLPAAAVAGIACLILAIALALPLLARTQWLRFTDPLGDHPPYARNHFKVDPGHAHVVYGGGLDIKVSVDGPPVDQLEIVFHSAQSKEDEVLPMFAEAGAQWRTTLANVTSDAEYFVRTRGARSERFRIDCLTVPQIQSVKVRITPPTYTRESPYDGPIPADGIAGLPGTQVQVTAISNRALAAGMIDLAPPTAGSTPATIILQPAPGQASQVTGTFTIDKPAKFTLHVKDAAGQISNEAISSFVSALSDERPFIRIVQPPTNSFATPEAMVPVVLSAEDDYGISRIELFRSLNDSHALPLAVTVPATNPRQFTTTVPMSFKELGLQPGDVIKLFARVEDNDPAGAKGSESTVATIQIISRQEFDRMVAARAGMEMLESKYDEARRRLEQLREAIDKEQKELAKADPKAALAPEQQKALSDLAADAQAEAEALQQLQDFKLPFDLDKNLTPELEKMQKAMDDAAKQLAEESKSNPSLGHATARLGDILKGLQDEQQEFDENAATPVEDLAKIYPLMADEQKFVELYRRQSDLAARMSSVDGVKDEPQVRARMRDMEQEQRDLHQALEKLADDIDAHAKALPDDEKLDQLRASAADFLSRLDDGGAADAMNEAATALAEFSGKNGHASAIDARDDLEKLLSKAEGMAGKAEAGMMSFDPKLGGAMGSTLAQLLATGKGPGQGSGKNGGSSMQGDTLNNVGIYGAVPMAMNPKGNGGGKSAPPAQSGRAGAPETSGTNPAVAGAGASATPVPAPYKKRVGQYFQRVADELEQK